MFEAIRHLFKYTSQNTQDKRYICFYNAVIPNSIDINMQYYDEEKMQNVRLRIEKEILNWPNATTKKMYGCPRYKNKEKLFAFLVTDVSFSRKLVNKIK